MDDDNIEEKRVGHNRDGRVHIVVNVREGRKGTINTIICDGTNINSNICHEKSMDEQHKILVL